MDDAFYRPATKAARLEELPLFSAEAPVEGGYEAARDRLRLMGATGRVLALMLSHEWITLAQLRAVGGSSGDRRGRELRQLGFTIEKRRCEDAGEQSGQWEYRLGATTAAQVAHAEQRLGIGPSVRRSA